MRITGIFDDLLHVELTSLSKKIGIFFELAIAHFVVDGDRLGIHRVTRLSIALNAVFSVE